MGGSRVGLAKASVAIACGAISGIYVVKLFLDDSTAPGNVGQNELDDWLDFLVAYAPLLLGPFVVVLGISALSGIGRGSDRVFASNAAILLAAPAIVVGVIATVMASSMALSFVALYGYEPLD